VLREGEEADLFWTKEAGLRAGRLAEALDQWPMAKKIYERLRSKLPSLRVKLDKAIHRCDEHAPSTL
jgi:hypothetical protein